MSSYPSSPYHLTPLSTGGFDAVVVATGVLPRVVNIPTTPDCRVKVLSYVDVLRHRAVVGKRVAVIGAHSLAFTYRITLLT